MGRPFEDTRYNRQELIPQFGAEGQSALARARVASIGAGGVKSPFLYYLAAAGVGCIRIIDYDRVELSNLNRQLLFGVSDIGREKVRAAADRLSALNPEIDVEPIEARVDDQNIDEMLDGFSVIVEGGDSVAGRLVCNDYCVRTRTPMVHASAQYGYGYVLTVVPGSACMRCAFPDLPEGLGGSVPIIGVATGIAGALGAAEVIKIITGQGQLAIDSYVFFSVFGGRFDRIDTPPNPACVACAPTDG